MNRIIYLLTLHDYTLSSIVPRTLEWITQNISYQYLYCTWTFELYKYNRCTPHSPRAYRLYVFGHHWAAARVLHGHVALQMEALTGHHYATSEIHKWRSLNQLGYSNYSIRFVPKHVEVELLVADVLHAPQRQIERLAGRVLGVRFVRPTLPRIIWNRFPVGSVSEFRFGGLTTLTFVHWFLRFAGPAGDATR